MYIYLWRATCLCLFLLFSPHAESFTLGHNEIQDLYIEPSVASVYPGENVTFTCSSPSNVSFLWHFDDGNPPSTLSKGTIDLQNSRHAYFWSTVDLLKVDRAVSKKVSCSVVGKNDKVSASLVVNGVRIGGNCLQSDDCATDRAQCLSEVCSCPLNHVLLHLKSGQDVCREIIYKLYDPCDFTEQCINLVDSLSVCGSNGICTCASWATDFNGQCVSKNELTYSRNQEMYRVGLIAITCVIIIVVAVSMWITLRRSCHDQTSITPRRSIASIRNREHPRLSNSSSVFESATDKPPSYDELVEIGDTVTAPPSLKDALKYCMSAKKLIRQVSAPAGQLLSQCPNPNLNQSAKTGCVSPVFTKDE